MKRPGRTVAGKGMRHARLAGDRRSYSDPTHLPEPVRSGLEETYGKGGVLLDDAGLADFRDHAKLIVRSDPEANNCGQI
jgi:hypothetical protein